VTRWAIVGVTLSAVLASSRALAGQTPAWVDRSGHTVSFVRVEPDVSLEVLDWGGSGPPVMLLAGLGNTAHVFDHFAHQFTDRFHVLGMTRRGFGASTHPGAGYDRATRARDILALVDQLGLNRVILIGHSIAGDELTAFAASYATRVHALVYLDAAYDRTKVKDLPQPAFPEPLGDTYSSVEKFTAYLARVWNWRAPEAEAYNTRIVSPDGQVGDVKTARDIPAAIVKQLASPEYDKVRAPALALYARPQLDTAFPFHGEFNAESLARAERIVEATREYQGAAISAFRAGADNREVVVLDGNHYLFFSNEADLVRLVRAFLQKAVH
jgi:pimeloyl-ACP methyl ester carboxylesterase